MTLLWFYSLCNQCWIFIGRADAEAEAPIFWSPDVKSWLIGKGPDAGKDWGQEEKGMTDDEMVGWHHQLNRHEFEQTLRDGQGQGSLVCRSPWGHKELGVTSWLTNNKWPFISFYIIWLNEHPSKDPILKLPYSHITFVYLFLINRGGNRIQSVEGGKLISGGTTEKRICVGSRTMRISIFLIHFTNNMLTHRENRES